MDDKRQVTAECEPNDEISNPTPESTHRKAAQEKTMSLINAAYNVLKESEQPLSCREMVEQAVAKGYWKGEYGRTPAQTLYAAISRERKKGNERFIPSESGGKFKAIS